MATVYDDVPPRTIPRAEGPRVEDAPPVNDRQPRPTIRASAARLAGTVKAVAPPVARGAVQLGTLAAQVIATGATLSVVGSALLLAGGYADDGVGSLLLCLLAALFAAILTTVFVVLLGLPLRVVRRARLWWVRNGELAVLGALGGAALMIVSMLSGVGGAPNWWLLVPGWLLFGFSLAHTWWPDRWRPERFRSKRPEPRLRAAKGRSHTRGLGSRLSRRARAVVRAAVRRQTGAKWFSASRPVAAPMCSSASRGVPTAWCGCSEESTPDYRVA
jgi:hypothetical protein